jgi:polyisoprenoid-binding protein YceI
MCRFKKHFLTFCFVACFSFLAHADYVFLKEKSQLNFTASTWMSDVKGTFGDWSVTGTVSGPKLNDLKFKVTVNTASLNTRTAARDKHLKTDEYFWVEKYPTATFESSEITMKDESHFRIKGLLTFRGVQKNIEFDARLEKVDALYHVYGSFVVNRREYGIETNGMFLVPIRDNVTIGFDVWGKTT